MLKLLSLFSGIGAFEKALENIGEPFEVVRYCEIDKYASKAYSLIHNLDENMNLKDVTTVQTDELPDDIDFITYGFPCQDISQAGNQKGFTDENGELTRSGLFFEALRIIEDTQPLVAIAENVKALTGKRFTAEFKIVLDSLNDAGYRNYWAVLNAKDYGIPQNRERVFIVSIRDDIDHGFTFPEKYELKLRLKDLLEDQVDEKFYLTDKMLDYCLGIHQKKSKFPRGERFLSNINRDNQDIAVTISTNAGNRPVDNFIKMKDGHITDEPYLPIKEATKQGYKEAHEGDYVNLQYPNSKTRRGRVGEQCANTLLCNDAQGVVVKDDSPTIQRIDIPQIVSVRKYKVNKERLVEVLRNQKKACGWTNKELAEELEVPLTKVEHWFRTDDGFAIPDPEIWSDLKWLLEMDDIDEFDEAIMTFEEREGTYEKANRYYHENGISPAITVAMANEKIIIDDTQGFDGTRIYKDYSPSLRASRSGLKTYDNLRIRKLTPKECFRLMGFDDKDCDVLVENKISNTQIYKMAGNSIVVDVLEEIFVELLNQYDDVFPMCEELQ